MQARHTMFGFVLLTMFMVGCASHDRTDLVRMANISLAEAVKTAEASLPDGRAVEAELEREDGRTVYEVELVDSKQTKRKIYVDAGTGKVVRIH